MKTPLLVSLLLPAALIGAPDKHSKKDIKYTTDPTSGVQYHFFKHDKKGEKPVMGDFATAVLQYRNDKDSVIFDSHTAHTRRRDDSIGVVMVPLEKTFNGCLEQGITLMAIGDSAEFRINTDSIFLKTFKAPHLPNFAHSGTFLTFDVKLIKFQTKEQIQEEEKQLMAKQQASMEKMKEEEPGIIAKYLSDNHYNVQPTADSIFFLQNTPGSGKAVNEGDSVEVKYKGMFLDGSVFDQSSAHGGKGTFSFQYSQHAPLIQGWIKVIGTMKEGQKVTVLIPSKMAYGPRGAGGLIQPYTPLLFDIELVKVTSTSR